MGVIVVGVRMAVVIVRMRGCCGVVVVRMSGVDAGSVGPRSGGGFTARDEAGGKKKQRANYRCAGHQPTDWFSVIWFVQLGNDVVMDECVV